MTLMGPLTDRADEENNRIFGYGKMEKCSSVGFRKYYRAVILLEVIKRGVKFYGNGKLLCTFESEKFNSKDISQISASGVKFFGVLANTCDDYILS
ncbi:hypothetical protein AB6A40_010999 [Gnathostoma spinigerum]|uniref:Uncharacterized protein n=1 Tax=Gnathostoma spinigerum TaxID=75299 RepID=A0ABD6EWI0_9BILA